MSGYVRTEHGLVKGERRTITLDDGRKARQELIEGTWEDLAIECTCHGLLTWDHLLDADGECPRD